MYMPIVVGGRFIISTMRVFIALTAIVATCVCLDQGNIFLFIYPYMLLETFIHDFHLIPSILNFIQFFFRMV